MTKFSISLWTYLLCSDDEVFKNFKITFQKFKNDQILPFGFCSKKAAKLFEVKGIKENLHANSIASSGNVIYRPTLELLSKISPDNSSNNNLQTFPSAQVLHPANSSMTHNEMHRESVIRWILPQGG